MGCMLNRGRGHAIDCCINRRSRRGFTLLGAITLLGHELPCRPSVVLVLTMVATSARACFPRFWPSSASVVH